MKLQLLIQSLLITGSSFALLLINPAFSKEAQVLDVKTENTESDKKTNLQAVNTPIKKIPHLSEIDFVPKVIQKLVQSPVTEVIEVTGVQVNTTEKGLDVILQTSKGEQLQVSGRNEGNAYIADIPNAQLRLPNNNIFRQEKPLAGIAEVVVTNQDANTIRVTVRGETGAPTIELFDSDNGLIFEVAAPAVTPAPSAPQPQQQPQTPATPPPTQPESQTQPEQPSAETDEPIELVVTGEQDGYSVPSATTGTRTDTPIRDTPFSIQVVPQEVLEDQQVQRLNEALRNISGVTQGVSTRSPFDFYTIRGFGGFGTNNIIIDGLRDRYSSGGTSLGNVEQVEVLKGPAGALFGQGTPGGTINVTTKRPLSTPAYDVELGLGNFNTYIGSIDLTGPLDENKNILYRFSAYGFSSETFVDFFDITRYSFAPALSFRLGENTNLTVEGSYSVVEQKNDRGLPARGTVLPNPNGDIPLNRFLGEPSVDFVGQNIGRIGYQFEHNFNDNWQLRNSFRATFYRQPQNTFLPLGLQEDGRTLERLQNQSDEQDGTSYILDTNVVGNFKTGSIAHKLLFGVDLYRDTYNFSGVDLEITPIDIFNPVYGRDQVGARIPDTASSFEETNQALGIYIQDQITLLENLKILLGGRFDLINQRSEFVDSFGDAFPSFQQDEAFSPRFGIVYQPIPEVSLYASYARSFQQVVGTTFDRRLFKPERGTQWEVGVKTDLTDRLSATLAYYNITRSNVLADDPENAGFSVQTGEQNSQGVELDIAGEILPGWKIIASAAYTDAKVTEDADFSGNKLNNVPEFGASLWTTYEIQRGDLQGLGFGFGLFYVGEREGDIANTFTLPSYVRTDAAIFYQEDNFRASINIKNLFNIEYFESARNDREVFPGDPLTVVGSVSWKF